MPPLEPNWKSYIGKTIKLVLTPQQCSELIRIGQSEPKINAAIIGTKDQPNKIDLQYRKSIISWIPFAKADPIYQIINHWLQTVNNNSFGFDNVQLTEPGQYAEYSKGGYYNWHMDSNVTMESMPPVRKISMTLLLNDPKEYEGGDLEIFCDETLDSKNNKFQLIQGQAVFFASFLLHRITPVTKGNRKSLVMWFGGPPLR
jgi:PKHD-type hydroxylase